MPLVWLEIKRGNRMARKPTCEELEHRVPKQWHSGGYSETQLDENVFKVSFYGNRHTGREQVIAERTP